MVKRVDRLCCQEPLRQLLEAWGTAFSTLSLPARFFAHQKPISAPELSASVVIYSLLTSRLCWFVGKC